jgi:signal recognition particle receptor subunit beta
MAEVKARILLWGITGAGKSTTLQTIYSKLRPDLRGELRQEPTALDPTVHYETLPILLGKDGGAESQLEVLAVPGAADQAMTRKQLLDEVDGIILVLDCSPEQIDANGPAIDELRSSLEAYGRKLEEFPLVLQYNKRDIADPFAIEDLHRRIGLDQAAVFETIATTGHGILATLTTLSKHVVRTRRGESSDARSGSPVATTELEARPEDSAASSHELLEAAILAEANDPDAGDSEDLGFELSASSAQPDWNAVVKESDQSDQAFGHDLHVVSVGQATIDADRGVRLPLVLGDESGRTRSLLLSLRLDALLPEGRD